MQSIMRMVISNTGMNFAGYPSLTTADLVIHFRAYFRGKTPATRLPWRLAQQPFAFFEMAAKLHRSKEPSGKIWIVCKSNLRPHPTVQRLVTELGATVVTAGDGHNTTGADWWADFLWVASAKHICIATSTFGFWAAFLSFAETVHFPIFPGISGFLEKTWCHLMVPLDSRYIYHDWWGNKTFQAREGEYFSARGNCERMADFCPNLFPENEAACFAGPKAPKEVFKRFVAQWFPEFSNSSRG
ncbi:unnamed protein product [Effrenium voratum]|nr:unnamed protein product [Effrenium voratum]